MEKEIRRRARTEGDVGFVENMLHDLKSKIGFIQDFFVRDISKPEIVSEEGASGLLHILLDMKDDIDFISNKPAQRDKEATNKTLEKLKPQSASATESWRESKEKYETRIKGRIPRDSLTMIEHSIRKIALLRDFLSHSVPDDERFSKDGETGFHHILADIEGDLEFALHQERSIEAERSTGKI